LWHAGRKSLVWLDILEKTLFEKRFGSSNPCFDSRWPLPEHASFIATDRVDHRVLWMVTDLSIGRFNLNNGSYSPAFDLPIPPEARSNDGGVSPSGHLWFGTMQWKPTANRGEIYSLSPQGDLRGHGQQIGIPNTFSWSPKGDRFYLSDSLQQVLREYPVFRDTIEWENGKVLADLNETAATPDGAAMDLAGQLWNAQWDGSKVATYSAEGKVTGCVAMPVPRPTSCCFGGPGLKHLFITSARCDMSRGDLSKAPASGNVFVIEQEVAGLPSNSFYMGS
jgi:sugar lactone lactonase YvrE